MSKERLTGGAAAFAESRAELLAPAGSFEAVRAAVNAGADAVYMGGQRFGARAYAESARADEQQDMLREAIDYCHLFDVKLYMTVNTLFKNAELKELFSYMKPYAEAGVDAVIVQDMGAAAELKRLFPGLELHASTQMTVSSVQGVRMAQRLGIHRVVLARELSREQIARIYEETGAELECFVHGAMCYSYSGACFMSSLLGGRSGNRGRCAGTCRLCYEAQHKKGNLLSLKDMYTLPYLSELLQAGVYSLKIEGRMKSPLYTAGVVSVYRKYLDMAKRGERYRVAPEDERLLRNLFDRGGTTQYLYQHNGAGMVAVAQKQFREPDESLLAPLRERYLASGRQLPLRLSCDFRLGQPPTVSVSDERGRSASYTDGQPIEASERHSLTREELWRQLSKTGGSLYRFSELEARLEAGLFMPVGRLKQLRRGVLAAYEEARLNEYRTRL